METVNMSEIQKRQHFYFKGREEAENGNLTKAIESFIEYGKVLAEKDKHIPQLWISEYYTQLGNEILSLEHLVYYAQGCSEAKASEVYKDIGEKYYEINQREKALQYFEYATTINPNIGVKTLIQKIKDELSSN